MYQRLLLLLTVPIIISALYCQPAFGQDLSAKEFTTQDFSAIEAKAKAGDMVAQYQIALKYYHEPDILNSHPHAIAWFKKAAEQGLPEAAYCLGIMHEEGKGTKKNAQQAKEWYTKAANAGHVTAQYHLGLMLYEGYGIPKDMNSGVHWFQQAAAQGFTKAEYRLGYAYSEGKGVAQNTPLAIEWLTRAAAKGEQDAITLLSLIKRQHVVKN